VAAQRIEISSEDLNLQVDVDDDGRIAVAAITGGGALAAAHPDRIAALTRSVEVANMGDDELV
jgi:hypothetical protein